MSRKGSYKPKTSTLKWFVVLFAVQILFKWVGSIKNRDYNYDSSTNEFDLNYYSTSDFEFPELVDKCYDTKFTHQWRDYSGNEFQFDFEYCSNALEGSSAVRGRNDVHTFEAEYQGVITHDSIYLGQVVATFKAIRDGLSLSDKELAELVVSAVQSMEYYIVHAGDHSNMQKYNDEYYQDYCQKGMCYDHIDYFGVLSPLEFLHYHKGDCDSRTVFLYAVMQKLGLDVEIFNSETHSMLGIAGIEPDFSGYAVFKGKRYYLWETTAENWRIGQFSGNYHELQQFKGVYLF